MQVNYELSIIDGQKVNLVLMDMVTNHNNGKSHIDLDILECYLLALKAGYPSSWNGVAIEQHTVLRIITVHEKEKILFTIKEKEVYDLSEITPTLERNAN